MNIDSKFQDLIKKIEQLKGSKDYDLSLEEDLSIAVMNLISLEEHFFFTSQKTGELSYLDLLAQTREIRKELLAKMIDRHEGETWCISKHLLAATMRIMEVGTKYQTDGNKQESEKMFKLAYKVFSLFWAVRLKLIDLQGVKSQPTKAMTFEDIVTELVDCCKE
jgi:hypothetical protein